MAYSVLYLANTAAISAVLHSVLKQSEDRFHSIGQFSNSLDALSFSASLKPQIVILEAACFNSFITWPQFVRDLFSKAPQTQYIVLADRDADYTSENLIFLPATDLSEDRLLQALDAAGEKIKKPSQNSTGKAFRHTGSSWFRTSQQFSELISNAAFAQSDRFDRSLIRVKREAGWLLVGEHRGRRYERMSFFQDPGQLDSLLQEISHILNRSIG